MQKATYGAIVLAAAVLGLGSALASKPAAPPSDSSTRLLDHGKYLVTRAAPCADCHSPHDLKGRPLPGRDLQGAPIGFEPTHPVPGWVDAAPSIAGLPAGWSFLQTVNFLETGVKPDGSPAGPPMPPFRFNAYDARAIATYLQSLPRPGGDAY